MKTKLQTLLIAAALAVLGITAAYAGGNPNPGILPPHAKYKGRTAGEWTAAWWRWVYGTPGQVQMYDDTGEYAYVNANGDGPVFFMAKSWAQDGDGNYGVPQVRHVILPPGQALYIPVMGQASGRLQPFEITQEFIDDVNSNIPTMRDLSVIIDGVPVAGLEDGNLYYLNNTGVMDLTLWDGTEAAFYGYEISLLLTPLTPGQHVIEMKGKGAFGFATDVTYDLTVLP